MEGVENAKIIYRKIQSGSMMKMQSHMALQILFVDGQKWDLPIIKDSNLAETGHIFTKIYNLSNHKLNDIEKSVSMMGLKLTPTPEKNNPYEPNDNVNEFFKKNKIMGIF